MKNSKISLCGLLFAMTIQANASADTLDGHYLMKLKIGDRTFDDKLSVKGTRGPILLHSFSGKIAGEVTVPGVFTSPLDGSVTCSAWAGECRLEFVIFANEDGRSFKVRYKAQLNGENYHRAAYEGQSSVLTGETYLEDGALLGTFEARKE